MLKHTVAACLLLASLATGVSAQEPKLESDRDKASYLIGRNIGETINRDGIELNIDNLVQLYRLKQGGAAQQQTTSAQPSDAFVQTQNAQQVPSPMGVMPSGNSNIDFTISYTCILVLKP